MGTSPDAGGPVLVTTPWGVPDAPRVVLLGDSYMRGLGSERRRAFGKRVAAAAGAGAVLDLCAVSLTAPEIAANHLDAVGEFAPDLAVLAVKHATRPMPRMLKGLNHVQVRDGIRQWLANQSESVPAGSAP